MINSWSTRALEIATPGEQGAQIERVNPHAESAEMIGDRAVSEESDDAMIDGIGGHRRGKDRCQMCLRAADFEFVDQVQNERSPARPHRAEHEASRRWSCSWTMLRGDAMEVVVKPRVLFFKVEPIENQGAAGSSHVFAQPVVVSQREQRRAMPDSSPGSMRNPVRPSSTASPTPPDRLTTTGSRCAAASRIEPPRLSSWPRWVRTLCCTNTSARRICAKT